MPQPRLRRPHGREPTADPASSRSRGHHGASRRGPLAYAPAIDALHLSAREYDELVGDAYVDERIGGVDGVALVVVDDGVPTRPPGSLPIVVCWLGDRLGGEGPAAADLVAGPDDVETVRDVVLGAPQAAATLAVLLRALAPSPTSVDAIDVEAGLAAESAAYSVLQCGAEFAGWRASRVAAPVVDDRPTVTVERSGATLTIVLDRPQRHNAITARLRDELVEALALASVDASIGRVVLRGNGPSFCSGGDLDEFGARPDPASAHVTRLARSPARLLHAVRDRLTVEIHGAALGGGIEMAAFGSRVVADPGTRIGLPEIGLGLIPGAGGTVSITRRCGRQRTAALALGGGTIDAATALGWGLVDEISER